MNPHVSQACETEIGIPGATIKSGTASTLTSTDIHAHNTFEQREAIVPQSRGVETKGQVLNYHFPPASVTKLTLTLQ